MNLEGLPGWALEMLEEARVARLGLLDEEDRPRVLPVTFAVFEGALWSAIDHKPKRPGEPARVRRLRRRPEATLLVDRYDDDWSRLAWVEAARAGVGGAARAGAWTRWRRSTPSTSSERPQGPLLRLAPERFACWRAAG